MAADRSTDNGIESPEWVIALVHGRSLVGRLRQGVLSPVFELQPQLLQGPQGLGVTHLAVPVCLLASWESFALPAGCPIQRVSELAREDRMSVSRAVDGAQKLVEAIRLQRSGIVVAGAGTQLPKLVK